MLTCWLSALHTLACVFFSRPFCPGDRAVVEQVRAVAQERGRHVPEHALREDRGRTHDAGWVFFFVSPCVCLYVSIPAKLFFALEANGSYRIMMKSTCVCMRKKGGGFA